MTHTAIVYTVAYSTLTPHGWFCWACRADTGPLFLERDEAQRAAEAHNEDGA